jgi:3-methyladenine DNA glycosylase Tag
MSSEEARTGWHYRDKDPPNDNAYFENMSRIVFKASMNWQFIEDRWEAFRKAFHDFDINIVSDFDEEDIQELMTNKGIIKSRARIEATLYNAIIFQKIIEEYGSFRNFIDQLDKSENYRYAKKELCNRFERLTDETTAIFLYSIGEDIILD